MSDALKETLDSLISLLTLFFKHFSKEFFDSIFHKLLALKKKKFMKAARGSLHLLAGGGSLAMGGFSEIVLVILSGPFMGPCQHVMLMKVSFRPSIMEPVNSTTRFRKQWTHLWDSIDKSLCRKEVSFIHIHRGRKGSADAIARGVGL
ncbi:hypothetical protein AMTRI_Chr09g20470 [Amborella trichopoda]